ncbi:MAG: GEVED domain-containing protein, partial [Planctomycetota bacterium]
WYENISLDFGDAPGPYPTTESQDAARHLAIGPQLGADRSIDSDGQPSSAADQDDFDDGIVLPSFFVPGETQLIDVNASEGGLLSGWIDFNADGNWDDVGEQIFADVPVTVGDQSLEFQVPPTTASGLSYARFRISTQPGLGVAGFASDGEVEDYTLTLPSAPTDITLIPGAIDENVAAGAIVGILGTIDDDSNDSHIYRLVAGDGHDDNGLFTISGTHLLSSQSFDFETQSTYSIRVETRDQSGLTFERDFTINIVDVDEIPPTIHSITPSLETGIIPSGTDSLTIQFSELVTGALDSTNIRLYQHRSDGLLIEDELQTVTYAFGTSPSPGSVTLQFPPLAEGIYRLAISDQVKDIAGNALAGNRSSGLGWMGDFVVNPEGQLGNSPGMIDSVSINSDLPAPDHNSFNRKESVSQDGRYVVFESDASNLVPNDTNGYRDIFLHDRETGHTTRISTSSSQAQANGYSYQPSISSDGRFVAFASVATNLVTESVNGFENIYVKDLSNNTLTLASSGIGNAAGNASSYGPSMSGDGRFVTFYSFASNLVTGDTNGRSDVFLNDLSNGTLSLISTDTFGNQGSENSYYPSISDDGRYIAFESRADNLHDDDSDQLADVFVKDAIDGSLELISTSDAGVKGNSDSSNPLIDGTGRNVAFHSYASNLIPNDVNGNADVFLKNLDQDSLKLVSQDTQGNQGNYGSFSPSISHDGLRVAFSSYATNLAADDTNDSTDVFVRDVNSGKTIRVSLANDGNQASDSSHQPAISSDGKFVSFYSSSGNLVESDSNGYYDVFVVELNSLEVPSFDVGDFRFDIDVLGHGTGQLLPSGDDALDGVNRLIIDQVDYEVSSPHVVEDEGKTIKLPSMTMAGLNVHREVNFPDGSGPTFGRTMDVFHNPTSSTITVPVRIVGNLGSDDHTTVFSTSDGDAVVESTDYWIGTDDADGVGSPAIVHLLRNQWGIQPTSIDVVGDNVFWDYSLTIPAGETVRLAHFTVLADTRAEAIADADELFDSYGLTDPAAIYLSSDEIDSLANFALPYDFGDAPSPYPTTRADNGARHVASGPRLGATRDAELDAAPSTMADGDGDDEDGVMFGAVAVDATMAAVNIEMQDADVAFIDAWIDFNQDGDWDDEGEKILDNRIVFEGLQTLNFEVGDSAISGATFARVRISSEGGLDANGAADDGEVEDYQITITPPAAVVGRHVFYNRSFFDGSSFSVPDGNNDSAAIDPTKSALLPGEVATAANYTNYARGINGIFIDVENLPGDVTSEDFEFHTGNDNTPANWDRLTAPVSVEVFRGAGLDGSDRIRVTWEDNVIQRQWLQVTLKANVNTGLSSPDIHYWGNAIGDTYDSLFHTQSNATDQIRIRSNPRNFLNAAAVDDIFDINKDRFVNATDEILARNNGTNFLTDLNLISPPA